MASESRTGGVDTADPVPNEPSPVDGPGAKPVVKERSPPNHPRFWRRYSHRVSSPDHISLARALDLLGDTLFPSEWRDLSGLEHLPYRVGRHKPYVKMLKYEFDGLERRRSYDRMPSAFRRSDLKLTKRRYGNVVDKFLEGANSGKFVGYAVGITDLEKIKASLWSVQREGIFYTGLVTLAADSKGYNQFPVELGEGRFREWLASFDKKRIFKSDISLLKSCLHELFSAQAGLKKDYCRDETKKTALNYGVIITKETFDKQIWVDPPGRFRGRPPTGSITEDRGRRLVREMVDRVFAGRSKISNPVQS